MSQIAINFITESNRIEGIKRPPTEAELHEYHRFMALHRPTVEDMVKFVAVYQPNARLRDKSSLNVRVGNHIAPAGGMAIVYALEEILNEAMARVDAYEIHQRYEKLHPFTDGNGRSGRMLWWWQMRPQTIGFLHAFYYQALSNWREEK